MACLSKGSSCFEVGHGDHFVLELKPPDDRLRHAPMWRSLIDKRNFNLFQPLLYQVSTGLVSRDDIAHRSGNWWAINAMCRCCLAIRL